MLKSACKLVSLFSCEGGRNIDSFHQRLRKKTAGGCTDDSEAKGIYCCSWGPKFGAQNKHWEAQKSSLGVSLQRYICSFPIQEEEHLSPNILILFLNQGYRAFSAPVFFSLLKFFEHATQRVLRQHILHPMRIIDTVIPSLSTTYAYKENRCVHEML